MKRPRIMHACYVVANIDETVKWEISNKHLLTRGNSFWSIIQCRDRNKWADPSLATVKTQNTKEERALEVILLEPKILGCMFIIFVCGFATHQPLFLSKNVDLFIIFLPGLSHSFITACKVFSSSLKMFFDVTCMSETNPVKVGFREDTKEGWWTQGVCMWSKCDLCNYKCRQQLK